MRRDAIVIGTSGGEAEVSVLREEACAGCSGRHICGSSKKLTIRVRNDIGAKAGDTVVIETSSTVLLGYTALLFLAPVLLGVMLYIIFIRLSSTAAFLTGAAGFVLPYIAAFLIEKKTKISVPVICEVRIPEKETPPCGCGKDNGEGGGD